MTLQHGLKQGKLYVVPQDILALDTLFTPARFTYISSGDYVCVLDVSVHDFPVFSSPEGELAVQMRVLSSEGVVASVQVKLTELVNWKEVDQ